MTTKKSDRLTLKDRLSRLNFQQACKLLGEEGSRLIQKGGSYEIDIDEQVYLGDDLRPWSVDDGTAGIDRYRVTGKSWPDPVL